MNSPKPKTKGGDLLTQLFRVASTAPLDTMRLKRIEREVELLEPTERAVLKGAIAATQQRYDQTKSQFELALALSGSHPEVLFNYAVSLAVPGHYLEARDFALQSAKKAQLDLFRTAFDFLVGISAYESAAGLLALARNYNIEVSNENGVRAIAALLSSLGRSEDEPICVAGIARSEAAKRGFLFTTTKAYISYSLAQPSLVVQLVLDTTSEDAYEIETAIFERLCESPVDMEATGQLTFLVTIEPVSVRLPGIGEFEVGHP